MKQLLIGLYTEGPTDIRFLKSVIKRSFEKICYECQGDLEIFDIQEIKINKSSFVEDVINASHKGANDFGIMILCVHTDADNDSDEGVYRTKINPALIEIESTKENVCKVIIPVVPVQMIESWMLADRDLLRKEIGTGKTDNDLGIYKHPEQYASPKEVIKDAIRIANQEKVRRRRNELNISDLYLPIGQSISINMLEQIPSYKKFQDNIREALKKLNYLY
ncbi:DUF4276 family protein [Viscerimonas tarda]